jgi:hypothetical protein
MRRSLAYGSCEQIEAKVLKLPAPLGMRITQALDVDATG